MLPEKPYCYRFDWKSICLKKFHYHCSERERQNFSKSVKKISEKAAKLRQNGTNISRLSEHNFRNKKLEPSSWNQIK